jgi:drug/metabolite transporter (DMT)-like permease
MRLFDTARLAVFTVMLACGQVMFKRVGLTLQGHSGLEGVRQILSQPSLYTALTLYGCATLLWIWILSSVSLVQAYPWVSVGMIIVPLLGWLVFGESVTPLFWLGVAFIIVGVGLTQYASVSAQTGLPGRSLLAPTITAHGENAALLVGDRLQKRDDGGQQPKRE